MSGLTMTTVTVRDNNSSAELKTAKNLKRYKNKVSKVAMYDLLKMGLTNLEVMQLQYPEDIQMIHWLLAVGIQNYLYIN